MEEKITITKVEPSKEESIKMVLTGISNSNTHSKITGPLLTKAPISSYSTTKAKRRRTLSRKLKCLNRSTIKTNTQTNNIKNPSIDNRRTKLLLQTQWVKGLMEKVKVEVLIRERGIGRRENRIMLRWWTISWRILLFRMRSPMTTPNLRALTRKEKSVGKTSSSTRDLKTKIPRMPENRAIIMEPPHQQ